jgi:magnesium transporter
LEALEALCQTLAVEDLAELVDELEEEEQIRFFESLPVPVATEIFQHLDVPVQRDAIESMSKQRVGELINEMDSDDRTALLETLPKQTTAQLLSFLRPRERAKAQSLLEFPEDSVGRLMTPDFLAIRKEWSVQRVLEFIRRNGEDKETLNDLYVVDGKGRLIDDIGIRDLLLADPAVTVESVLDGQYPVLKGLDPQEEAIQAFKKYSSRTAVPVVDEQGALLGIVTIDDILHLEERESTEDIQKFGGVSALDESYLDAPLWRIWRQRAMWLSLLFVGELFTASAMGIFEQEIHKAVVLALFLPLIISSGGNSGSQAATLVIRAIALGEVAFKDWVRVFRRELAVGIGLGLTLGLIGFLRIAVPQSIYQAYGNQGMELGVAILLSLIGVVSWGTLIGSMMPLILKRLGLDPAASSAPFVATFIDVTGIVLYFKIALWIMGGNLI